MKLRKIILLPLLLVGLVSCGGGKISPEKANARVVDALEKTSSEPIKSIELTAAVDASVTTTLKYINGSPTENNRIEIAADGSVKAKDLDKGTAQIAIEGSATIANFNENVKQDEMRGSVGLYYVDNFAYLNLESSNYNGYTGLTESLKQKQKMEAGPFPGIESIAEQLEDLLGVSLPEELPSEEQNGLNLIDLLNLIGKVTATEKNDVLTVKYEIETADVVKIYLKVLQSQEGFASLTSQEIATIISEFKAEVDRSLVFRKALITFVISKTGFISGLTIDLDIDMNSYYSAWNEDFNTYTDVATETTTIKGKADLSVKINEAVNITFPSFDDYVFLPAWYDIEE